jgi:hypothetical protein
VGERSRLNCSLVAIFLRSPLVGCAEYGERIWTGISQSG